MTSACQKQIVGGGRGEAAPLPLQEDQQEGALCDALQEWEHDRY